MYRQIGKKEEQWIKKLMSVDFKDKDILIKQFSEAKILYKKEYDFISMKFKIDKRVKLYPYDIRVPVEMRAIQNKTAPIVFLLHIIDGIIDELEIITADSTPINDEKMELNKVVYEVNERVRV